MAMTATTSILGLYSYKEGLFDGLELPESLDREAAISTILADNAGLELLYPSWDTMRGLIGLWSKINQFTWSELAKTLEYDYDPIANYDRNEEWTDTAHGTTNASGTADGYTYGFNSEEKARSQSTEDKSKGATNTEQRHTGRVKGNIGVTSTQELIRQQREAVRYNIYKEISQSFKNEFCLMVY